MVDFGHPRTLAGFELLTISRGSEFLAFLKLTIKSINLENHLTQEKHKGGELLVDAAITH